MAAAHLLCHSGTINRHPLNGTDIMNLKTSGIDWTKDIFPPPGVGRQGTRLFNQQLRPAQMTAFFCQHPHPATV
ncbi:hypothetical protein DBV23_03480 [Edwardsiella ictaluri]|uniref:Transposase n=1 Tax=Edwardsiella ictaluri TaxID=67780 RepID=Q1AC75_EDWIC|nr:transposase [Edwardsiella ictaluri 93-146]AVZ81432.1 hypothetical protein DBV23_03480 [Edwardsiella ictaluri]